MCLGVQSLQQQEAQCQLMSKLCNKMHALKRVRFTAAPRNGGCWELKPAPSGIRALGKQSNLAGP